MKCPSCQNNQHVRQSGLTCTKCSYKFVFNPKAQETILLTDGKFQALIRRASQSDKLYFTNNQLYSVYTQGKTTSKTIGFVFVLILSIIAVVTLSFGHPSGFIFLAFAVFLSLALLYKPPILTRHNFFNAITKWQDSGKPIDKLLEKTTLHDPPPEWKESDIFDYGVERILIVQRELMVDLLVLNNAHAEQRALVISESGYPAYLTQMAGRLIEQRPDLPVFILHDGDEIGQKMRSRIEMTSQPIKADALIDMGLYPNDFRRLTKVKNFDKQDSDRRLPMDALPNNLLMASVATCFVQRASFDSLLTAQASSGSDAGMSVDSGSSDFG